MSTNEADGHAYYFSAGQQFLHCLEQVLWINRRKNEEYEATFECAPYDPICGSDIMAHEEGAECEVIVEGIENSNNVRESCYGL